MKKKKVINEAGKTAYELMVILPNDLGEQKTKEEVEIVKALITERDGEITHEDYWGNRTMAYPMKKYETGYYFVLNFVLPGNKLSDLNKNLLLNTVLLRFLINITPPNYTPVELAKDAERLGLDVELKNLTDIDSLFKKREDKFEKGAGKAKRVVSAEKVEEKKVEKPKKEVVAEPVVEVQKEEEKKEETKEQKDKETKDKAAAGLVADPDQSGGKPAETKDEAQAEAPKKEVKVEKKKEEAKESAKKEDKKEEEETEDRLAELDRKLDELLNKDL